MTEDRHALIAHSPDFVVADIAESIVSGRLASGRRLPSERHLATQYGVGRPLIREALRSLSEMGLVETHPARGTFVRDADRLATHRPLEFAYRRRGGTARQLQEARMMLETQAASLAADRATASDIRTLESLVADMDRAKGLEHVRHDVAFHLALAAAAHNPLIETMFRSIVGLTVALMLRSVGDHEVMRRAEPYHRLACDAIRARDSSAASAALRGHLTVASETYGGDYDRSVNTLALRALRHFGSRLSLDQFVSQILPDGSTGAQ